MTRAQITNATQALEFIYSGKARITLVSKRTKWRYTYKITRAPDNPVWFIGLLTAPDKHTYLATMFGADIPALTKRSQARPDTKSFMAIRWAVKCLRLHNEIPDDLEIWHEGKCGACGRPLTVPESIASGIGPVCAARREAA